jgi:hypothetical protein
VQDRLGFDDSPLTVPAGFFRLEGCYDFKHECDEDTQEAPAFLFRVSLTPKIEARWQRRLQLERRGRRLSTRVGFKIDSLNQDSAAPDLAVHSGDRHSHRR